MLFLTTLIVILLNIDFSVQHAYLYEPPSRASAWLNDTDFAACCKNYDYNQMYCGGSSHLWSVTGGRCGICGDPYDQPEPRTYEKGGEKYLGKIVRTYSKGAEIPVIVQVTANHLGFFEFKICKVDGWESDATQSCLNKTVLTVRESNSVKYPVRADLQTAHLTVLLPPNLVCRHCVLQWRYVTGNSWGFDPETNTSCLGCGPVQENFLGCADISIKGDGNEPDETTTKIVPTIPSTTKKIETTTIEYTDPIITTEIINESTDEKTTTIEINSETTTHVQITTTNPVSETTPTVPITTTENLETSPIVTEAVSSTTSPIDVTTSDNLDFFPIVTETFENYDNEKIISTTTSQPTKTPGQCTVKYEFGTKINIERIVTIYCNRMCNLRCKVILAEFEKSIRRLVNLDIVACIETCPALCDCP
ncbi:unnamed protein product [Brachionus calyciflorus]|uniref:Chitin-binding type-4 domain-containing protein n=1 Tax=Brachionus calyciflorus TaxID=104777 RepID=A0A813R1B1_9BILA|nr:unnamed protein product [Brachionus calyciflorus]